MKEKVVISDIDFFNSLFPQKKGYIMARGEPGVYPIDLSQLLYYPDLLDDLDSVKGQYYLSYAVYRSPKTPPDKFSCLNALVVC